jgi:hypothetical protein
MCENRKTLAIFSKGMVQCYAMAERNPLTAKDKILICYLCVALRILSASLRLKLIYKVNETFNIQ